MIEVYLALMSKSSRGTREFSFIIFLVSLASQWPEMVLCVSIASMAPIVPYSFFLTMNVHSHNINLRENCPSTYSRHKKSLLTMPKLEEADVQGFYKELKTSPAFNGRFESVPQS